MKEWYYIKCMFEKLEWVWVIIKKIEDFIELEGWEELEDNEKEQIIQYIVDLFFKVVGILKKKVVVQVKLIITGQVIFLVKGVLFVISINFWKFFWFLVKFNNFGEVFLSFIFKRSLFLSKCDFRYKDCLLWEF